MDDKTFDKISPEGAECKPTAEIGPPGGLPQGWGVTTFTYSVAQLKTVAKLLKLNKFRISSALIVALSDKTIGDSPEDIVFWVERMEMIIALYGGERNRSTIPKDLADQVMEILSE